ncbi:phosphonate ABC transporter, permease protein PhnE [Terrilactibacillus laevilacticus]|uniref:Phosphonate ABC transporter, permease protein PhnE n=1 Tax=Terrilactibacillus laevilacticus TaxID=1380157 RepID=A0ABW5PNE6_9BACI|nr:phosphonate ABC transporter, permease protein PhnE [Terrilactibacillus laevilacticus]
MDALKKRRLSLMKRLVTLILIIIILWASSAGSEVSISSLIDGLPGMGSLFLEMLPPDWSYFSYVTDPMLETIRMAIIGTTYGAIIAIPFALLSSRNVVKWPVIYYPFRFVMNLIRTIPELLLAALFVPVLGIGDNAGIMALSVFSFGVIAKLAYEAVEAIDNGPLEAMTAVGANKIQWIFYGVVPQVIASFVSYTLYCFEINVRAAAILGYVGAGGIGLYLNNTLKLFQYQRVSTIIIYTLIVVVIIDMISNKCREKLI